MFFKKGKSFRKDDLKSVIEACLRKDPEAEQLLIEMHLAYAKSIAMRYSGSKQEAEEIVYDGFLKVLLFLQKFDLSKPFQPWLKSIVIHCALDHYRKYNKHSGLADVNDLALEDLEPNIFDKLSAHDILDLVRLLPPSYRTVFVLYAVDGYSHREIAALLNIREGTSKSNLRDARRKLQELIRIRYPQTYFAYSIHNKLNEN